MGMAYTTSIEIVRHLHDKATKLYFNSDALVVACIQIYNVSTAKTGEEKNKERLGNNLINHPELCEH